MTTQAIRGRLRSRGLLAPVSFLARPVRVLRGYRRQDLQPDLLAGLTVGVILLPQALVFAVMAGLPPQMGVYAAIVGSIAGALWGSSAHLQSGPTNTSSLLLFSTLVPLAAVGSPEYIAAAGVLAVMVGLFRMGLGLLKMGVLVNFVSDAVVVGFTGGAGVLIVASQLRALLRLSFPDSSQLPVIVMNLVTHLGDTHLPSLAVGVATILIILLIQRLKRKLPGPLLGIVIVSIGVAALRLADQGVKVIGEMSIGLPPLAKLPLLNLELIGQLSFGALAIAAIGLVEAVSIARSLASQSQQRLDSNQEFVGQGMASALAGLFSGYTCSGSFNRSAALYQSGGRTSLASAFAGLFVLAATSLLGPLTAAVPLAGLAGVLIVNAYSMIDFKEMRRIRRSTREEAMIMLATLAGTLLLPLHFAVLIGILMSLVHYLRKTSLPQVSAVLPDDTFKHFIQRPGKPQCPQLAVIEVLGDLYFGAVNHVEEAILHNKTLHKGQIYLLLRMHNVQHLDISGVHMLESVTKAYRADGGDVYLIKVRAQVMEMLQSAGFESFLGTDHFLEDDQGISHLFHRVLDPAVCIYECETRAFLECQNLPRPAYAVQLPTHLPLPPGGFQAITPRELYERLRQPAPPIVIDIREPREFRRGHIPQARNLPLPTLLAHPPDLPLDDPIVLVCRTSRRSRIAAQALHHLGFSKVIILDTGMVGWEAAHLLEAIEDFT